MRRLRVPAAALMIATAAACRGTASSPTLSVEETPPYGVTVAAEALDVSEVELEEVTTASTDTAEGDTLNRGGLGLGSGH
jgi:hypothetical protein